jgi:hypothetical protein
MNRHDIAGITIAVIGVIAALLLGDYLGRGSQQPTKVLVGQGCEGPDPIAVALEEDLLPRCERIDRHEVAVGDR